MKRYVAESFSRLFAGCNFFFLSLGNSLYREQFFQSRDDFEKTWNYREKFISKSTVLFDWKRVLSYQILLREKEKQNEKRGARGKVDGDCYNSYLVVQSFPEDPQRKTLFRLSSPEVVNDILSRPPSFRCTIIIIP